MSHKQTQKHIKKRIKAKMAWYKHSDETKKRISETRIERGVAMKENNPRWKVGKYTYYRRQAKEIWEEYWREEVLKGYVIHHIDRDYTNNDISNLALLTRSFHAKVHGIPNNRP